MLKVKRTYILLYILFVGGFAESFSQNHLNSPYSRFGLGELSPRTSAAVTAMGGTGYTFQSATAINFVNPAAYMGFDTLAFLLDAAFSWKNHTLLAATTQKGSNFQFDYLAAGFSIQRWWKMVVGIQPYSIMNYSIVETKTVTPDSLHQTLSYLGEGGINEVYWGNAFKLFKNFSIGVNASYLFGTYSKNRTIEWDDLFSFNTKIENINKIKGAVVTVGAQYFIPIKDKGNLGIGLIYTPSIPLRSDGTQIISTYWGKDYNITSIDSLYKASATKHIHKMPTQIGGGVSWSKKNKYFIGADFTWKNWSNYEVDNINDSLSNSYKVSIGGCYTPNYTSNKFFPRMTFSLGANIGQSSLFLKGEHLNHFGINFGLLFPLKRSKTAFGFTFEYGQFGTLKNNLIKENYFTATLNVRIHERWYQRKKLD